MDLKKFLEEFVKLKKEEFSYIDKVLELVQNKTLDEVEKLNVYRELERYKSKLQLLVNKNNSLIRKDPYYGRKGIDEYIINFSVLEYTYVIDDENLSLLGIDKNYNYKLTAYELFNYQYNNKRNNIDILLKEQPLFEKPIYIRAYHKEPNFIVYDFEELECKYYSILYDYIDYTDYCETVDIDKTDDFEKDKIIIYCGKNTDIKYAKKIFKNEMMDEKNKSVDDCVKNTIEKISKLDNVKNPKYKKELFLKKIKILYESVKGSYIDSELLYEGNFIKLINETYKLPNDKIVKKEKVIKNDGKDSVVIIARANSQYIVTLQNRIKDTLIAEFPAGYIEKDEDILQAAKRELEEETSYTSDDLQIIDEVYTSCGIDNSKTYIVVADGCHKIDKKYNIGTELVTYALCNHDEIQYLIDNNIMNASLSKLAYYNYRYGQYKNNVLYLKK